LQKMLKEKTLKLIYFDNSCWLLSWQVNLILDLSI